MSPYLHQLVKMAALSTTIGLFAYEWCSPVTAAVIGFGCLWLLTARAG